MRKAELRENQFMAQHNPELIFSQHSLPHRYPGFAFCEVKMRESLLSATSDSLMARQDIIIRERRGKKIIAFHFIQTMHKATLFPSLFFYLKVESRKKREHIPEKDLFYLLSDTALHKIIEEIVVSHSLKKMCMCERKKKRETGTSAVFISPFKL